MKLIERFAHWIKALFARVHSRLPTGDAGMSTAEYAVGTLAACAFALVLYRVVKSDSVMHTLSKLITSTLNIVNS